MSARTWFSPETCEGLTTGDCAILNRAARNRYPVGQEPPRLGLMTLRMAYRPGMSAADLLDTTEESP